MKGIDVSTWQGSINWDKVKEQVDFAILRLGYIGNNENKLDTRFEEYYRECKRLNIPIGVYVYSYVKTTYRAKLGAEWTLEQLKNKTLELPVYIDMEDNSLISIGKSGLTDIVIAYNNEIEKSGLWAGVYANLNWFNNYLNKDELKKKYTTWIAHYGVDENRYKGQYDMLQYTSTGRVNGITGNVDMNIMYRDLINEMKKYNEEAEDLKMAEKIIKELIDEFGDVKVKGALKRLVETYVDDGEPSGWAIEEIEKAKALGLTDGSKPQYWATRQEVMMMSYRAYDKAIDEINKHQEAED